MKNFLLDIAQWFLVIFIRIRYRITYKGLDQVKAAVRQSSKGCLFLPNHPAILVDPLIVGLPLIRPLNVRPVIVEYMYYSPLFHRLMRTLRALPIPEFLTGFNPLKLQRTERLLQEISSGLKKGDRFMVYPAGTTRHIAKEVIGGAFGVHQLIFENPDINIVLVRTTGLWGSSFSRALTTGESADMKAGLKNGFWTCLKNLLFFVPKREVTVEFELAGADFPRSAAKNELNRYLEYWYNKPFGPQGEPLKLVSYCFWKKELPAVKKPKREASTLSSVPKKVQEMILSKVAELAKLSPQQISPTSRLVEHLGLDSLDLAELISFLEQQFKVSGIASEDFVTVEHLFLIATQGSNEENHRQKHWNQSCWNKAKPKRKLSMPEGTTLPEVFLKACDGRLFDIACTDPFRGPISYYKLKRNVLILSELIQKMKGERIGIMLPASNPAQGLILACQMAGKTAVMLNWSMDKEYVDVMIETLGIEVILSSWIFLDRFEHIDLSNIASKLIVLEELKVEVGFGEYFKKTILALMPSSYLIKRITAKRNEAVVLCTAGTETMPKCVPLSHENILFDIRAGLNALELYEDDRLLSMLPPFNAFGLVITGLLPLLSGMRVYYFPNPTDSHAMALAIEQWKISLLSSAPTLIKNMFLSSKGSQLTSLRMVISGGAKPREEFFALLHQLAPQAEFVEGYGACECSSVVCINSTNERKNGVGKPLAGIKLMIVNPDNLHEARATNEVGLILVSGPTVFSGYLNMQAHNPFIDIDTTRWYQTGDLGKIDQNGNLILFGRLKRVVMIGKEMVSLGAIEEALASHSSFAHKLYAVMAIHAFFHKVRLVLFTDFQIDKKEINQILAASGFKPHITISRVIRLDAIPLTITGRVAYRKLEKLLHKR